MTFGQLVRKNVVRQKRLYIGYIASSSVSVMILFMFMNFVYNPAVVGGYMPAGARMVMLVSGWLVALFSVFFIFYFHTAMLRLRGQEFGLLQVLGMTPKQMGRMVIRESAMIDGVALGLGLLFGLLFTKLFLLAVGDLLVLPMEIPFAVPAKSWLVTCIVFILIFALEGALMAFRIRRRGPKHLLFSSRSRQKPPHPSLLLAGLGVVCVAVGYYLAIAQSVRTLETLIGLVVIIALVVIGTYLIYTQVLVWVLMRLRGRVRTGVALLTVSRLAYRMKDHARALTVIATLSAVVMTGAGTMLGFLSVFKQGDVVRQPFAVITWTNANHPLSRTPADLAHQLNASGAKVTQELDATALAGTLQKGAGQRGVYPVSVVSRSTFQRFVTAIKSAHKQVAYMYPDVPKLAVGHALYVASFPVTVPNEFHDTQAKLTVGRDNAASVVVDRQISERTFNFGTTAISDNLLVVSDADFRHLKAITPSASTWTAHAFTVANLAKVPATMKQQFPSSQVNVAEPTDQSLVGVFSTMIFSGMFISLMMLLACGNTLYFRLLNNRAEDGIQFRSLRRIGTTHRELGRVLTAEFSVLFFFPFVLAAMHSIAAIIDFRHVLALPGRLWPVSLAVLLAYLAFMVIYFIAARITYPRQLHIDDPRRAR
ncbi:ABC transporter permease [Alicyclobacillus suci]|uniref:ABC transporter permease n=1 Tax=Alicyclobacillus suci TaxID=2816080 RepID=UPI001A8F6368|nr:ABC transporter permease [Alicyclobacillus suci]